MVKSHRKSRGNTRTSIMTYHIGTTGEGIGLKVGGTELPELLCGGDNMIVQEKNNISYEMLCKAD